MRVCYFGTYDPDQPRTRVIMEGLRKAGIEIIICHAPLWTGTSHKVAIAQKPWRFVAQLGQVIRTYFLLLAQARQAGPFDVIVYAHLGQIDLVLTAWWFKLRKMTVVWDALISLYDTVVEDRGLLPRHSLWGWGLEVLDRLSGKLADVVLVDTAQNEALWHTRFLIPFSKLRRIYVGVEDAFTNVGAATKTNAEFNVLFYGNYIPLHGIETIVRAAKLLESHQHIVWTLIGTGQQRPFIDRLTEELQVRSIRFVDWVPYSDIPAYIARADVCLGIFGATEKAARVVPNKAYQALPAHRPLITGDTPAARAALLRDGIEGAWLVPVGDANSLAQAVLELSQSPQKCATLAQGGVELYRRYYSSEIIGKQVAGIFTELV